MASPAYSFSLMNALQELRAFVISLCGPPPIWCSHLVLKEICSN